MKDEIGLFQRSVLIQRATTELLQRHRRRVAANTLLPSATPEQRDVSLRAYTDEELLARAKRASPATVERMQKRAAATFADAATAGVSVWDLVDERSGSYDSWYTFKACVQRYLEDETSALKRQLDRWQRETRSMGPSPGLDGVGLRLVARLEAHAMALRQVPSGAPERFKEDGKSKRYVRNSKSRSIRTAEEDWRERAADAMAGDLKVLFLLQCVTGCRPQELANGVRVRFCRDGTMVTRVAGAKCDGVAGQPTRCLRLAASEGVAAMLARMLTVGRTLDSRKCGLGRVNTYAKSVSRACGRAFPDRKGRRKLSCYSARHQFKADLVAAGWAMAEVAMAMGHSTTRSGTAYGQGGKRGSGGVKPIAIKALRPVKLRGMHPRARSVANTTKAAQGGTPRKRKPRP